MDEKSKNDEIVTEESQRKKKRVCVVSIVSFAVGIIGIAMYCYILESRKGRLHFALLILGVLSMLLAIIAKNMRVANDKSGKGFEIIAIVLGGFSFYSWIYLMPQINLSVGFLGWIVGGLIYKFSCRED